MNQFLSDAQLAERYSVNRTTIWRWVNRGYLPKPVKLSPGCTRWRKDDIERRDAERERSAA